MEPGSPALQADSLPAEPPGKQMGGWGENQFDVGRVSLKVFMGHSAASVSLIIGNDAWTLE